MSKPLNVFQGMSEVEKPGSTTGSWPPLSPGGWKHSSRKEVASVQLDAAKDLRVEMTYLNLS